MKNDEKGIQYKYLRIQGREIVDNTNFETGVFTLCEQLFDREDVLQEDRDLYEEVSKWVEDVLPFPPQCQNGEKVICYFKTENKNVMLKLIKPFLWFLDNYDVPYYLVYTNYPGEIVYEDDYQIVAKAYERKVVKVDKKVTGK